MTDPAPLMLYDRDSATPERVEVVAVIDAETREVRVWELTADRAISLGLGLATRGWRAKTAGRT